MSNDRLAAALREGRPAIGSAHMIQDIAITESLAGVDLDFLLVDMQHVAITIETLQHVLIALGPTDLSVLVRPVWNDPVAIGQVLDVGAAGVIVPMVNTAEDAARAVAAARYPPLGTRSWGPRRVSWLGGPAEYARLANDAITVLTQVETAEAVKNLDDILAVPGLDGVMVGPSDLAISLGYGDDRNNPEVLDVIQKVLDRCLARNVPFGFFAGSTEQAGYWIGRGSRITTCSADVAAVVSGMATLASALRGSVAEVAGSGNGGS